MDTADAFAVIQRALEEFNADVVRAQASQAQSEETIAAVEYEMEQLRKLIAENRTRDLRQEARPRSEG